MSYFPNQASISTLNSTAGTMTASSSWTGTWEDISGYSSLNIIGSANTNCTLFYDFSTDGITAIRNVQLSSGSDTTLGIHGLTPVAQYGRARVVDAGSGASIIIQTINGVNPRIAQPTSRMSQTPTIYSDVLNTRSLTPSTFDYSTAALASGATYTTQTFDTLVNGYGFAIAINSSTDGTHYFDESNDGTNWTSFDGDAVIGGVNFIETHVASARYVRVRFINGSTANAGGVSNFAHSVSQRASTPAQTESVTRVSDKNSYFGTMSLTGGYTGSTESALDYTTVSVSFFTPFGTACNGTLWLEVSRDNINWSTIPRAIRDTSTSQPIMFLIAEEYFRIRFENGKDIDGSTISTVSASTFQIQTMFANNRVMDLGQVMGDTISDWFTGTLGKSVLTGRLNSGKYKNVPVDSEGHLMVHIDEPLTAFGEMAVAQPTPVAQVDFVYGINNQMILTATTNGGTFTTTDGNLVVTTSAATGSTAIGYSSKYLKYRDGQGAMGRITGLFTSGVTGNNQYVGIGTSALNGYFFGYSGTTFGIHHRSSGSTVNFYPQSSWTEDVMDGSNSVDNPSGMNLDPTKGNVYQIKFQFLGYGNIFFYIEDKETGDLVNVHQIKYPNTNTIPSLRNPSVNLIWASENTTNNTAVAVKGASGALFVEGQIKELGPKNAIDNNKAAITTLTNIFSLKNATTYNTLSNRAQIKLRTVSVAYDGGNGIGVLQIHKNATLGGAPSFTTINGTTADNGNTITNGNSVASYDVAGTTVTPNTNSFVAFNVSLSRNTNIIIDVSDLDIYANPGDVLTFACKATTSGAFSVSANWNEDI